MSVLLRLSGKTIVYASAAAGASLPRRCLHRVQPLVLLRCGLRCRLWLAVTLGLVRHVVVAEPQRSLLVGPCMPGCECGDALLQVFRGELAGLVVLAEGADRLEQVLETRQLLSVCRRCRRRPRGRGRKREYFFTSTLCAPPLMRAFRAGISAARSGDREGHRNG